MGSYVTIQGDTWDNIAFKLYGNEFLTPPLLESNPDYIDIVIFPSGIVLFAPSFERTYIRDDNTPPWRDG